VTAPALNVGAFLPGATGQHGGWTAVAGLAYQALEYRQLTE
jgi:hypothetical protein